MPAFRNPYHYTYLLALQRLFHLQERIGQLQGQRYPTSVTPVFLEACRAASVAKLSALEDEASYTEPDTMDGDDPLSLESMSAHELVDVLELQIFQLIERATVGETPGEWILPLTRYVNELEANTSVIFHSITNKNYVTYPDLGPDLERWFSNHGCYDASKALPSGLVAIGLCSSPPAGSLGYSLVSHEIGHILCNRRGLVDELISDPSVNPRWMVLLTQSISLAKTAHDWLEEWLCDAIGAQLTGPAFGFASLAFHPDLLPETRPELRSHPPWRVRFPLILRSILDADPGLGYGSLPTQDVGGNGLFEIVGNLRAWRTLVDAAPGLPPGDNQRMSELLDPFQEPIVALARRECQSVSFGISEFQNEVPPLVARLANGLPPNEIETWDNTRLAWEFGNPSIAGVLNAAWVHNFSGAYGVPDDSEDPRLEIIRFTRLLDKAVELAELQRSW